MEKVIFDLMWLFDMSYGEAVEFIELNGFENTKKKVEEEKQNV